MAVRQGCATGGRLPSSALASPPISDSETAWAELAGRRLSDAGYRRGGARRAVIALLARQRCALSAFEIEEALRASEGAASRASIYRVLDELERLGLVSRLDLGQGILRYEPVHPHGHQHHHHLVCDGCGAVFPFEDSELERIIDRVARRVTFDVAEHEIVLHGSCHDCRD